QEQCNYSRSSNAVFYAYGESLEYQSRLFGTFHICETNVILLQQKVRRSADTPTRKTSCGSGKLGIVSIQPLILFSLV
uniref:Uncharacterized protein n=1 Tax=Parascaris univalens TaxID=6257 RepID=A0A915C2V4_PARUN